MIFLSERTVLLFEPNKAFASVQNILTVSKLKTNRYDYYRQNDQPAKLVKKFKLSFTGLQCQGIVSAPNAVALRHITRSAVKRNTKDT